MLAKPTPKIGKDRAKCKPKKTSEAAHCWSAGQASVPQSCTIPAFDVRPGVDKAPHGVADRSGFTDC